MRRGYEFNTPAVAFRADQHGGRLPASLSFIQLDSPGIVLTGIKKGEDDNSVVLRCYETLGRTADVTLKSWLPLKEIHEIDMMEW